jgi:hypothetical protein
MLQGCRAGALPTNTTNNVTVNVLSLRDTMHTVTAGVNYHF